MYGSWGKILRVAGDMRAIVNPITSLIAFFLLAPGSRTVIWQGVALCELYIDKY